MKKCFGYVRVSTLKQGEGVSLDAQREAIEIFAARNNILICEWFEEKVTAAKCGRPMFNKVVRDLKSGKAEGLVIHKIDRSARNFSDWAKIGDLSDAGIDIHFAAESLDFRSRGGRLTADIQAVIAADYVRNLREECIKGLNGRLKQGIYPFAAPVGYLNNGGGKAKTIDPLRGPLVRQMFEIYASGQYSIRSLVPEMTRRGLAKCNGRPLTKTGIEHALRNPFYTGIIKIKRTGKVYPGVHEPLVSADLFDVVQRLRSGREHKKLTKHMHLFRGLFRCGHCGGAMIAELQKGNVYYRCHEKSCETKTVRETRLLEAVGQVLQRCALSDTQVAFLSSEFQKWLDQNTQIIPDTTLKMELAKIDDRLSRLTDKLIDDIIDETVFQAKKAELLLAKRKWEDIAATKQTNDLNTAKMTKFLELMKSLYSAYDLATPARKREIVELATSNRCVIGKNVELEPQNWLLTLEHMMGVPNGGQDRDSSRTFDRNLAMQDFMRVACAETARS